MFGEADRTGVRTGRRERSTGHSISSGSTEFDHRLGRTFRGACSLDLRGGVDEGLFRRLRIGGPQVQVRQRTRTGKTEREVKKRFVSGRSQKFPVGLQWWCFTRDQRGLSVECDAMDSGRVPVLEGGQGELRALLGQS